MSLGNQKYNDDVCIIQLIRRIQICKKKKVCLKINMVSQERKLIYKKKKKKKKIKNLV